MSKFATRLKQLREGAGLTQAELAKLLELHTNSISMYEQGRRTPPISGMEQIADFFNVDLDYLVGKADSTTVLDPSRLESGYYTDDDTKHIAETIAKDKDLRLLFDAARNVSADSLKALHQIMKAMKQREEGGDGEDL